MKSMALLLLLLLLLLLSKVAVSPLPLPLGMAPVLQAEEAGVAPDDDAAPLDLGTVGSEAEGVGVP